MKLVAYIVLLFCATGFAQKEITHIFSVDENVQILYLNLNNVFQIQVHTLPTNEVKIKAISEGEYANYFVLNEKQENKTLTITSKIAITFPDFQDKLSVHKVHAISVAVWIPDNLQVVLQSDIGNVKASGNFESFRIDLASGNCFLTRVFGCVSVSSVSGDIVLQANRGFLKTETNLGVVSKMALKKGKSTYLLKTNKGNITVENL